MSYDPFGNQSVPGSISLPRVEVNDVLRRVYMWMGLGLAVTALVALFTVSNAALQGLLFNPAVLIGAIIGELVLVIALSVGLNRQWLSANMAAVLFFVYSALNGFTLSVVLLVYTSTSVALAFFSTAGLFGAMTIYAFVTTNDLTKWGSYLFMGLIGLLIAMVLNMFFRSSGLELVLSLFGVVLFTALTAYDTQKIKEMTESSEIQADSTGALAMKLSIFGALKLYLDFINLFLFILRLLGSSRD